MRRLILPIAMLLAACQTTPSADALLGEYGAQLPAADAPGRLMTLSLQADGRCALTTAYVGKGAFREACRWSRQVNLVRLQLSPDSPQQETLEFAVINDALRPVAWSEQRYGRAGPGTFVRQ